MKFEKKELKSHQIEIIVEVDEKQFSTQKTISAKNISKERKIPGFRPGKAHYDVIVRMYGEEYIEERAVEELINKLYPEVIKETGIKPYGPGKLEEIISKNPPKYKFIIPLEPVAQVAGYKEVRKAYKLPKVAKKDIDKVLNDLQTNYATARDVTRASKNGDLITVKINAKLSKPEKAEEADILKDTPHQLVLGDHADEEQFPFKGFMKNLNGMKVGEKKEFSHKYAKDAGYENLQGKEVAFSIEIMAVKELIKPDLDDEFAKTLGVGTLQNLEQSVRDQLETSNKNDYENEYFEKLLEKLVNKSTLMYPPEMLENEIEDVLENFKQNISKQNLDFETYLKINNREKDEFIKEDIEPAAKKRLEQALVLEEISKQEKIEIDQNELQSEYAQSFMQIQSAPDYKDLRKKMTTKKISSAIVMQAASRIMHQNTLQRLKQYANGEIEEKSEEVEKEKDVLKVNKDSSQKEAESGKK